MFVTILLSFRDGEVQVLSLSDDQVRWLRLRAQRLLPHDKDSASTPAQLTHELVGIQAQDILAARLALRARGRGFNLDEVERAQIEKRVLVRTWGPRGTLHMLATEDLGWLLPIMGPIFITATQRRRAELGLDEATCTLGIAALREILTGQGALSKAEIAERLDSRNIHTEGQATIHLIMRAALEGVLCLGPERGAKSTYVLLNEWIKLGPSLTPEVAYMELARRYLGAYGPATPEDMAIWSGLPISRIRVAWQNLTDQLLEIRATNEPAWMLQAHASRLDEILTFSSTTRLLSAFDLYLLGYKKRDLILAPQYAKCINAGGGMLKPVLLAEGRVAGTWKNVRKKDHLEILVEPFEPLTSQIRDEIEMEVADLSRFLGEPALLNL